MDDIVGLNDALYSESMFGLLSPLLELIQEDFASFNVQRVKTNFFSVEHGRVPLPFVL